MDFHQIFRGCLPQEDLEQIRFWGYPATSVAMATLFFRICLSQEDLELTMFWGYPVATVAMARLLNFGVLKFLLKSLMFSVTKILKLVSSDLHKM